MKRDSNWLTNEALKEPGFHLNRKVCKIAFIENSAMPKKKTMTPMILSQSYRYGTSTISEKNFLYLLQGLFTRIQHIGNPSRSYVHRDPSLSATPDAISKASLYKCPLLVARSRIRGCHTICVFLQSLSGSFDTPRIRTSSKYIALLSPFLLTLPKSAPSRVPGDS